MSEQFWMKSFTQVVFIWIDANDFYPGIMSSWDNSQVLCG